MSEAEFSPMLLLLLRTSCIEFLPDIFDFSLYLKFQIKPNPSMKALKTMYGLDFYLNIFYLLEPFEG